MKRIAVAVFLAATVANARIPDFGVETAPEIIKQSGPKARAFYEQLVEHSKQESRRMVEDTKKSTGIKASDLKKVDWDCLFWRVAATTAKNIRRRFQGLQPPEFADIMEKTALDDQDCPDEGGPGSNGVKIYNAAINQVQAGRDGWQRNSDEAAAKALAAVLAAGIGAGETAPAAIVPAPAGAVPIIDPRLFTPKPTPDSL